jgi:hypothetical protein
VIVLAGAAGLMVSTIVLVRRDLLSLRYGIGWLTISAIGIVGTPVLGALAEYAEDLGFTQTGFAAGVFIVFLLLICLQLSISLSGLHKAIQNLAEHGALVENRVGALEARQKAENSGDEVSHRSP